MLFLKESAKEFKQISAWLNSEPLRIGEIQNKVILLDFFAYSCINCRREMKNVISLYKKYKDHGLVVIGVHAPEFEFEKLPENVMSILKKEGITYPVALDNEHATWYLYGGQYWPRQVVIDVNKRIILNLTGERHAKEIERAIRTALEKGGVDLHKISFSEEEKKHLALRQTPEVYAGFFRNKGMGSKHFEKEGLYLDEEKEHKEGIIYPHGHWKEYYEYLVHHKETKEYEHMTLKFHGQEVNIVAAPYTANAKVYVEIDRNSILQEEAGDDVQYENGQSYILVTRPELYKLFKTKTRATYELRLITSSPDFCLYSYTFG